jgi:uncharacterized protein with HEPN domain
MPRQYQTLLEDIRTAAASIQANATNTTFEEFARDENRVKAVLYDLSVIGEACRNIPDEIREKAPEIEWGKIVGLRHFIAHVYWAIKLAKIWDIVRQDIPKLHRQIDLLIRELEDNE